jgi:hypothetical protein
MMMGMTGIIIHLLRLLRIGGTRISGIGIGRMLRLLRVSRSKLRVLRIEDAAYVWCVGCILSRNTVWSS